MNPDLIALFREALDVAPDARAAFLAERCTDAAMRVEVGLLLQASDADAEPEPGGVLQLMNAQGCFDEAGAQIVTDLHGQIIGPFRLTRLLGSGGMGAVWQAERIEGFAQTVAIKWAHTSTLSAATLARFAQERQLLAKLNHPGIARLVDGGAQQQALWFAMEFVHGEPLDQYVDHAKPGLSARLSLLCALCDAVHYAHQNLIVHRDLKPANVMVQRDGQPKLLDFGIAKQLDGDGELTQSRAPMSLAYAAPEQIRGDGVTTATDVYALGVILFELLTGERPHKAARGAAADRSLGLLQAITDTDATAPSTVLRGATGDHHAFRAAQLRGDLDTIVLKALSRDPARRYPSAQALGDDLQRYQKRQPILARPDSWAYQVHKWLARHPLSAGLGAVAIVSLVALTAVSLQQARRADLAAQASAQAAALMRVEADQATTVSNHFAAVLAKAQASGDSVSTQELLDWAADAALSGEYKDPAQSRAVQLAISDTLLLRNDFQRALRVLDALIPTLAQASPRERLQAYANRMRALVRLGKLPEAQVAAAQARLNLPARPSMLSAELSIYEGELARALGQSAEAIDAADRATALIDQADDGSPLGRGAVYTSAASALLQLGQLNRAQRDAETALKIWEDGGVRRNTSFAIALATVANVQFLRGDLRDALATYVRIDEVAAAGESVAPRAARRSGYAKALALTAQHSAALVMIDAARADMCAATGDSSLDCVSMTLAATDVAQLCSELDLAQGYLDATARLLGDRAVPPIVAAVGNFRLREAALRNPSEQTIDAFADAVGLATVGSIQQRNAVRGLLVLAQSLRAQQSDVLAGRAAARALTLAKGMALEPTGMDRALWDLWQSQQAGGSPDSAHIAMLANAIGAQHPWVLSWRARSGTTTPSLSSLEVSATR